MIVLDTTILVYAKGAEHELREPCRRLIERVASGEIRATTTAEVIQEFAHVRARRRDREDAAFLAGAYAELLSPLLVVNQDHLAKGLEVFTRCERLGAFDSVLVAVAAANEATAIVSADGGFREAEAVEYRHPTDPI